MNCTIWRNTSMSAPFSASSASAGQPDPYGRARESILQGIVAAAHAQRQLRLDREEQQRRWAEEARLRAIAEARRRQTKHFVENLAKEADAWQAYCNMKAYVDHLVQQARTTPGALPHTSRRWLKLAAHLTRLTDPSRKRLAVLHKCISGHEWALPFGATLSGY